MLDPPPKAFPMPSGMARPLRCGFGSALNCQYLSLPIFVTHWRASVTLGTSSSPPASSNRTLTAGFSARRLATTDPVLSKYSISLKAEWVTGAASPDLARRFAVASGCYDGMMRLALDPLSAPTDFPGWLAG